MTKPPLTKNQTKLFKFIGSYRETWDYSPTVDEMMKHMNSPSRSTIQHILTQLEKKGRIVRTPPRAHRNVTPV